MTTSPLRRTQITVVERMRLRARSGSWESCAAAELFFKTKRNPPEMRLEQGKNCRKMQTRVYRSGKPRRCGLMRGFRHSCCGIL
jgi:hypothetical protein